MPETLPFLLPPSPDIIRQRRAAILATLCQMDEGFACVPVKEVQMQTLRMLLHLYDSLFLDRFLQNRYAEISVTLSSRLISAAGKLIYARAPQKRLQKIEIRMSSDFLFRLRNGPFQLNGLTVATAQEAFLLVFEHELCHAVELALFGSTGHSRRFLMLANGLFGHTSVFHAMPTRQQEAAQDGIIVGRTARFSFQGRILTGRITYVGKSVTVMVPDTHGVYRGANGRRYTKYRVSLDQLSPGRMP